MNDDFGLSEIDKAITESLSQPTLVDTMQETSDRENARKMAWTNDIFQNWPIYLIAVISAIFTATLGIFMGLSPTLMTQADGSQVIHFNTDFTHIMLAIIYAMAFVGTTELQLLIGKKKFNDREEGNPTQKISMLCVMTVAVLGMVGTGIAGGMVIAANIAFLTDFKEIPHSAQVWVIVIIPCLLAFYSVMYLAYALSSQHAKAERLTRDKERQMNLDHQTRIKNAQLVGERMVQAEEIRQYWALVRAGKITAGEARAAIQAGKTLGQLEKEKGRDLDGNGQIGTTAPRSAAGGGKEQDSHPGIPFLQYPQFKENRSANNAVSFWYCPEDGTYNTGNFCEQCGQKRPEKESAGRSNGTGKGF